jgi:ketosteroid isomerase-like protein
LDNYKRGYNTPEKMGVLTFYNHRIDSLGPDAANVFGEWKIQRTTETIGGYYTLLWSRKDQQWKITQDHTN